MVPEKTLCYNEDTEHSMYPNNERWLSSYTARETPVFRAPHLHGQPPTPNPTPHTSTTNPPPHAHLISGPLHLLFPLPGILSPR